LEKNAGGLYVRRERDLIFQKKRIEKQREEERMKRERNT